MEALAFIRIAIVPFIENSKKVPGRDRVFDQCHGPTAKFLLGQRMLQFHPCRMLFLDFVAHVQNLHVRRDILRGIESRQLPEQVFLVIDMLT